MSNTFYQVLENRFKAGYGVIWIQTSDFKRAYKEFKALAIEGDYNLYKWSCIEGLMELGLTMDTVLSVGDNVMEARQILTEVLRRMDEFNKEIFVIEGFQDFIHFADIKTLFQKLAQELPRTRRRKHIILMSPKVILPEELARFVDVLEFPEATAQEYAALLLEVAKSYNLKPEYDLVSGLALKAQGLTELEARLAFSLVAVETGFGEGALDVLRKEKERIKEKLEALGLEE